MGQQRITVMESHNVITLKVPLHALAETVTLEMGDFVILLVGVHIFIRE